jgi:hypothetical protein
MVRHYVEVSPRRKLTLPVGHGRQRLHHEEGPFAALPTVASDVTPSRFHHQQLQRRDRLAGFTQAHLISEDARPPLVPLEEHPVNALQLVLSKTHSILKHGRVLEEPLVVRSTLYFPTFHRG